MPASLHGKHVAYNPGYIIKLHILTVKNMIKSALDDNVYHMSTTLVCIYICTSILHQLSSCLFHPGWYQSVYRIKLFR